MAYALQDSQQQEEEREEGWLLALYEKKMSAALQDTTAGNSSTDQQSNDDDDDPRNSKAAALEKEIAMLKSLTDGGIATLNSFSVGGIMWFEARKLMEEKTVEREMLLEGLRCDAIVASYLKANPTST